MKNLERVADMLLPATTAKPGEPYDDLDEVYGRLLGQWALEMNHVAAIVGGFNSQQKHAGQDGVRFTPIPRATAGARRAVPERERLRRRRRGRSSRRSCGASSRSACSTASGPASSACSSSLLSSARIARLVEQEAIDGAAAYRPLDFLADVRKGIWSEVYGTAPVRIDAYRRNLQRAYVETLADRINGRRLPWTTRARSSAAS